MANHICAAATCKRCGPIDCMTCHQCPGITGHWCHQKICVYCGQKFGTCVITDTCTDCHLEGKPHRPPIYSSFRDIGNYMPCVPVGDRIDPSLIPTGTIKLDWGHYQIWGT